MTHVASFFSGEVMAQHWSDEDDVALMAVKKGAKKPKKKPAKKPGKKPGKKKRPSRASKRCPPPPGTLKICP